jgi:hypothetical protein
LVVPAGIVDTVDLDDRRLFVEASRDEVLSAPEFDAARPLDDTLREQIGRYFSRGRAETPRRGSASPRSTARPAARRRSAAKPRSRSSATDEPTKDELYQQARKMGIEGRSKMDKAQLKRAVQRRK